MCERTPSIIPPWFSHRSVPFKVPPTNRGESVVAPGVRRLPSFPSSKLSPSKRPQCMSSPGTMVLLPTVTGRAARGPALCDSSSTTAAVCPIWDGINFKMNRLAILRYLIPLVQDDFRLAASCTLQMTVCEKDTLAMITQNLFEGTSIFYISIFSYSLISEWRIWLQSFPMIKHISILHSE